MFSQPKKYNRFTLNKFESAILLSRLKKVIHSKDKKKLFHKPFKGFIDRPYWYKYFEDKFWKEADNFNSREFGKNPHHNWCEFYFLPSVASLSG